MDPSITGIIVEIGVKGYDRGPIQSGLDIDRPMQNATRTAIFSQNRRLAEMSARSTRFDSRYALISNSRRRSRPAPLLVPAGYPWFVPEDAHFFGINRFTAGRKVR